MMFSKALTEKFKTRKTPFFYYNLDVLDRTLDEVKKHGLSKGYHVHFAMKANNNRRILERIRKAGLGVDCVSGGEIKHAIDCGFKPSQIAFAGVGKTDEEIRTGLQNDIFSFNCESLQEMEVLNALAAEARKTANIAIRLNPNVEAKTHKYITTGLSENKFGVNPQNLPEFFEKLPGWKNLELTGIHFHIGSQILDTQPFVDLCKKVNEFQDYFEEKGITLQHINVGGGLGIHYDSPDNDDIPDFELFFGIFEENLELRSGQQVHFELGRSIVAQCGSLVSRVLYIKEGATTDFAIIDAGMTELIRPALYDADHNVHVLNEGRPWKKYDVVGPICESSDTFRRGVEIPEVKRGDLVAIRSCGAYGQVMSSDFNLRERAATVYSDEI